MRRACCACKLAITITAFLQDMPGWGDEFDLVSNLKTVVQFLLEQRKKDLVDNKAGVTGDHANVCSRFGVGVP
jgi:hypothetical protein